MRWTDNEVNDIRQVTRFLWFSKTIGKETRWLEWATYEERFMEGICFLCPDYWKAVRWV